MPRVLRIINRLNLGGPTYNVAYLSKYLSPEFETLLVSGMKEESEESSEFILDQLGLKPLYISAMKREVSLRDDINTYKRIKEIINEFKPDIVHTHAAKAGAVGRLAAHSCKVPVIVHTFHGHVFHDYFSPLKTKIFIEIEKRLSKRSTAIVAISEKQKYELNQVYKVAPENKTHVIRLGFDLVKFNENQGIKRSLFRKEYLIEEDEIVITITGRLVPIKNHHLFLNAIHNLKDKITKKVRFFIIGDGELREDLIKYCNQIGLNYTWYPQNPAKAYLTFTSWRKDIDVVNAGSDIIALCSNNEGTPVSLIEAQAANKPVLSTKVGGVENIISAQTGILVEKGDQKGFEENLLELINNDNLRANLSLKGWDLMKNDFHYTRLVEDTRNLYKKLLSA
jgi:glycosyltransferase involved in cell wall biosynthesis